MRKNTREKGVPSVTPAHTDPFSHSRKNPKFLTWSDEEQRRNQLQPEDEEAQREGTRRIYPAL